MIELKRASKDYQSGTIVTKALIDADLSIDKGEFVVILGPSGSGKSTMLNLMGGLDHPTQGKIVINDRTISDYDQKALIEFRRETVGFVFQEYNLLHALTVGENISVAAHISKHPDTVENVLKAVGLEEHIDKYPYQLSGGEQQRVSIARALIKRPTVLFCDEPTGSLDEEVAKNVLRVLKTLNRETKTTVVLITHNVAIAQIADRVIRLNSGKIIEDRHQDSPEDIGAIHF